MSSIIAQVHFEWTINLGNIIAIGVLTFTLYRFHMSNVKRYMVLEFKVNQMWEYFRRRFKLFPDDEADDE